MKVRKRIQNIEGAQWKGDNFEEVYKVAGRNAKEAPDRERLSVATPIGIFLIDKGDWVLVFEDESVFPVKEHIFDKDYEIVEDGLPKPK